MSAPAAAANFPGGSPSAAGGGGNGGGAGKKAVHVKVCEICHSKLDFMNSPVCLPLHHCSMHICDTPPSSYIPPMVFCCLAGLACWGDYD